MLVSVIIPTLNEEASLPVTLRHVVNHPDVELIVVDGGSIDQTRAVAQRFTPYVFLSHPGRARQMNMGARHATGDILLFLHADTLLQPGALDELQRRLVGDGAVGGAFDLHIDAPGHLMRIVGQLSSRRSRLLGLPYGDQGLFVWRQVFDSLGGFPELPILEDLAFAKRLRRAGRLTFLRTGLVTGGRRWIANGIWKTTLTNWWVKLLWHLRIPPSELRRIYDRHLVRGNPARGRPETVPPNQRRLQGQA